MAAVVRTPAYGRALNECLKSLPVDIWNELIEMSIDDVVEIEATIGDGRNPIMIKTANAVLIDRRS
jgi:hypothetical protein